MKGEVKRVVNLEPKFGARGDYLFVKVESGSDEWQEEYLLVTDPEAERFRAAGLSYTEVTPTRKLGRLFAVDPRFGRDGVWVKVDGAVCLWVMTADALERIRERVDKNAEDIEANREGWLRDLVD